MSSRYTRLAAIALLLLALALGGYAWLLGRKPPPQPAAGPGAASAPAPRQYAVVVASRLLAAGQPIDRDAVRVVQLPIKPADALADAAAAVGRVPVYDIAQDTPLSESQLVSGLALRLEPGERAVAVKADEVMGVGNKVRPGDFVDVFFVLKSDSKDVDRSQARLLLPRMRVLAFGSASVDGAPPSEGKGGSAPRGTPSGRAEMARTAVLAVPVDQVNRLALGDASARLLLALRRPDDAALPDPDLFAPLPTALKPVPARSPSPPRAPLAGIDLAQAGLATADLAAGGTARPAPRAPVAAPRAPAGAAPAGHEVEVFRGTQRETLRY